MKKRITWIDILRIIGMIGVITIHIVGNTINTFGLSGNAKTIFLVVCKSCYFTLPLFVMISGSLFLSKDICYKDMFLKYIKRILLVIVFIGGAFAFMEEFFINRTINMILIHNVFNRIITGGLWEHMWYLYLIMALYLITPLFRVWCKNSNKKDQQILLIILFVFTILKYDIDNIFGINIAFYIPFSSGFLFAYLLGFYLYSNQLSYKNELFLNILGLLSMILVAVLTYFDIANYLVGYTTTLSIIIAANIYVLIKKVNIKSIRISNMIKLLGECSFGIYIFHQLFINIVYKVLKIDIILRFPYAFLPIYILLMFIITFIFVYFLRKIKIVRKYFI